MSSNLALDLKKKPTLKYVPKPVACVTPKQHSTSYQLFPLCPKKCDLPLHLNLRHICCSPPGRETRQTRNVKKLRDAFNTFVFQTSENEKCPLPYYALICVPHMLTYFKLYLQLDPVLYLFTRLLFFLQQQPEKHKPV